VRRLSDLQPYIEAWDRLALASHQQLPALSHAWVSTYFEHRLLRDEKWCCLLALAGSRLVGVLPLILTPEKVLGFQRVLLRPPRDPHTISADVIVEVGYEALVLKAFLAALEQVTPQWHAAKFLRLPQSSPTLLLPDNEYHRCSIIREPAGVGAYLPVVGDYAGYRASLSGNFRSNLNKAARKLADLEGVKYEFLTTEDRALEGLERFMAVETSGWKGREGSAIGQHPTLVDFYSTLVQRLAAKGWLEWQFLVADGKTLAGNFTVRCGRSMAICKLGYDESYAKCGPGNMLFEHAIERAFEAEDIDQIDMMSDMPWYYNWKMQKRQYHDFWVFPHHPLSIVADIVPRKSRRSLHRIRLLRKAVRRARGVITNLGL
jgi:CelD/BcsL family acetyltransferase involved in cellulose biosynthesis